MADHDTSPPRVPARTYGLSVGQVAEWLVWSWLVGSSSGDLHVFLPLRDEGIDGIVHRLSTDAYARVQVKGRHPRASRDGVSVEVRDHELVDDRAVIVAVAIAIAVERPNLGLAPSALVVDVPTFRERATRSEWRGIVKHAATVTLPPAPRDKWAPWCLPLEAVGDRLLPPPGAPVALPAAIDAVGVAAPLWTASTRIGYRAEMELVRRSADVQRLNLFKAHPDLEPNEYVLYDLVSRGILGVQVKAVTLGASGHTTVNVFRPALRPSSSTWFVVFSAHDEGSAFDEVCAVVPSQFVAEHLAGQGPEGKLSVSRGFAGRLAPWRVPVAGLGDRLAEVAASLG